MDLESALEGRDDLLQEKEDTNRALPHVRLSGENWSDRSVGRTSQELDNGNQQGQQKTG